VIVEAFHPADLRMGEVPPRTLIDELLEEQGRLTAVEQFARVHEHLEQSEPRYRALLPATPPGPGSQLAFEVDLDKCSGCKACVTACHSLNGLDEGEAWREVGELISDDWRRPARQVVTTACHHCVEPACLEGCPVLAYEKDPATGVVRHLDDQCIGCQYCVMMCPYDVPKYSEARGIVRKCDLCAQRLAVGEAPACVQACPNEAIRITVVAKEEVREKYRTQTPGSPGSPERANAFLPASPDPALTLPTTRFVSKRPLPSDLVPAPSGPRPLAAAHWPLVWMLVFTQLSVGLVASLPWLPAAARPGLGLAAVVAALLGIGASAAHLGRPTQAWRSFLGLRTSWLSREIVAFGGFLLLVIALGVMLWANTKASPGAPELATQGVLMGLAAGAGLVGVFCSGMVYHVTGRVGWRGWNSVGRFAGTCLLLGLAGATWAAASHGGAISGWTLGWLLAAALKLAGEHRLLRRAQTPESDEAWPKNGGSDAWSLAQSAVLMRDRLGGVTRARFFCGLAGGVALPAAIFLRPEDASLLAGIGFVSCLAGELAERFLFFRAVVPPRMPVP
jgi:Fe-S-cluster-containing dehydrogenase component/DMSO reductase anchor subunit